MKKSILCSAWPSLCPYCMNQKQSRNGIYFEMPLLSRHQGKELGQNLLTSRNCHSKLLFLWQILTDIPVILTMNMGLRQNPHVQPCQKKARDTANPTSLPWWLESHWVSGFLKAGRWCTTKIPPPCFLLPSLWDIHTVLSPSLGIHLNYLYFTQKSLNTLP